MIGLMLVMPLWTLIEMRRSGLKLDSTTELVGTWVMVALGVFTMIASVLN